ncbi:MAG: HlyD family efflux transporter periplasmic adaptor subunit [Planctomycetes bacterium]|nr:HlyD family efflux transporter periplasmic adaptor subunit [Planctomycetota bacterium]
MIRTYLLPVLALAGIIFAGWSVAQGSKEVVPAPAVAAAASSPFPAFVAGAGMVEASSENIAIGVPAPGIVESVAAKTGVAVKQEDVLFVLDQGSARAAVAVAEAAVVRSKAERDRLAQSPRPEEIPPAQAHAAAAAARFEDAQRQLGLYEGVAGKDPVAAARVELDQAKRELGYYESLPDKKVVSTEDFDRRRFALRVSESRFAEELERRRFAAREAEAQAAEANGRLALLQAGAWKADLAVADAAIAAAQAQLGAAQEALAKLTVRAPIDGTVLQVSVHPGESLLVGPSARMAVLLGTIDPLMVRVDIDENDAWRVRAGAKGKGFLRGNSTISTDLVFSRFEPYVVPKRSLTGDTTERVDTRVLQVLFTFDRASLPVFVGQQMDVFVEAP